MIAQVSNITSLQTIYTCPSNTRVMAEIYLYSNDSPAVELLVNDITIINMPLSGTLSIKLVLDSGDVIKVNPGDPASPINAIISGIAISS